MRRESGFTLIELMISVTLVAALSTGMLFAMRTALVAYEKTDTRLQSNRRVVSVERITARELGGVMPVMGTCSDGSSMAAFNGDIATLHLVTSYSIAEGARGLPHVIEWQVLPIDGGGVRLIANEYPYSGPTSIAPLCSGGAFRPGVATPQSFVLADKLAYCRLSYMDVNPDTRMGTVWVPLWNKPNLPAAVHVDMAPMFSSAVQVPLVSVTAPVHITRDVNAPYSDGQ